MPKYFYTAKSLQGENKNGEAEAKDTHQLAQDLKSQGLILIKANSKEEFGRKKTGKFSLNFPFSSGVSLAEKMFFTRNLQTMISAGIALPRAINALSSQAKSKKFKNALLDIQEKISQGKSLSEAMSLYPRIFPDLFQSMIRVGEEGGTMENVLKTLALQMERDHDLRSKIRGAMVYPLVIVSAMVGIGVLMLVTVVPKLSETFKDLGVQLPLTTQIVINFSIFLVQKWYIALIAAIFIAYAFWQGSKTKSGKLALNFFALKFPVFSKMVQNTNLAYTARTLSSLIASGVALPRSLEITSDTLDNIYYKNALREAAEKVRTGEKLSDVLKGYDKIISQTFLQMLAVGEETGETSTILAKLADFYEEEVSSATKNLASVIEPLLMIVIGAIVGFFAVSMIQPMYSMLGAIE